MNLDFNNKYGFADFQNPYINVNSLGNQNNPQHATIHHLANDRLTSVQSQSVEFHAQKPIVFPEFLDEDDIGYLKDDTVWWNRIAGEFNLKTAVQDAKAMQDFDSESLLMGAEHSQKVKAAPIKSDYGSKDCVDLASSTAVFRFNHKNIKSLALEKIKQSTVDFPNDHIEKFISYQLLNYDFKNDVDLTKITDEKIRVETIKRIEACYIASLLRKYIVSQFENENDEQGRIQFCDRCENEYRDIIHLEKLLTSNLVDPSQELTWLFRYERAMIALKHFFTLTSRKGIFLHVGRLLEGSNVSPYIVGTGSTFRTQRRLSLMEYIFEKPRGTKRKKIQPIEIEQPEKNQKISHELFKANLSLKEDIQKEEIQLIKQTQFMQDSSSFLNFGTHSLASLPCDYFIDSLEGSDNENTINGVENREQSEDELLNWWDHLEENSDSSGW